MFFYCDRLFINEVADLLRKKERAAKSWCLKNRVEIFKDGTRPFVVKAMFDTAYDKPLINSLTKKHGDNWEQHYQLIKDDRYYSLLGQSQASDLTRTRYQPVSNSAKKIKERFK